jgi:hypothetical protein
MIYPEFKKEKHTINLSKDLLDATFNLDIDTSKVMVVNHLLTIDVLYPDRKTGGYICATINKEPNDNN